MLVICLEARAHAARDCMDTGGRAAGAIAEALPSRLLAGLYYLKYTFNESDESVVYRWIENPYWQYFCGFEQLQYDSLAQSCR